MLRGAWGPMTLDPVVLLLGGLVVLFVAVVLGVVFATRAQRRREHLAKERRMTSENLQDITHWVEEGRRLFSLWQDGVETHAELQSRLTAVTHRLTAVTQEVEQLRAEATRLQQENELLWTERAEVTQLFTTILDRVTRAAEHLRGGLGARRMMK